ncbi:MAG: hypothetical protein LAN83_16865 [Acidobacteriia bacterium]|nr:hypothetical protein [Terriglobia bacterium]
MKRVALTVVVLVFASVGFLSCGGYGSSSSTQSSSGLAFKAFVSNPLQPVTGGTAPVLNIVDAAKDVLSPFRVSLTFSAIQPGLMAVSPNKNFTMLFSPANNSITLIDNINEIPVQGTNGSLPPIILPDFTESMFVAPDNATGWAAVPNAPVLAQDPGVVELLTLATASIKATIPIPHAHYIVMSHSGERVLAMGENSDTVTVIAPSLIGTGNDPLTPVCCFDHPVGGIFSSDDTTAYIFDCGPECNGTAAGVTVIDMNTNTVVTTIPVEGATAGFLSGNTLYVAGTPAAPGNTCTGTMTQATVCGRLDVVDVSSMTVTSSAIITDGYHTLMAMGANGQLFVGGKSCTNINNPPPGEVRGCLSIFNTSDGSVVNPPATGVVTGMQPITNRSVMYVVQDGELAIYDTTTDALQSKQIDIIGQAFDVKLVD